MPRIPREPGRQLQPGEWVVVDSDHIYQHDGVWHLCDERNYVISKHQGYYIIPDWPAAKMQQHLEAQLDEWVDHPQGGLKVPASRMYREQQEWLERLRAEKFTEGWWFSEKYSGRK